jgi:DDE superfamily endonuclease
MLLHVPPSLDGLLSLFASCFTQPSFHTFRALLVGQVSQTGVRTVCGMLVGARLSTVWEHSRAHRFFSHARWSTDELGLRIVTLIVARLTDPGAPLTVAIDDTLLQRWGRRVYGCFYHHDATSNSGRSAVAWGNNWVVVGIVVRVPILARPVCLPVLFRLSRPKRKHIRPGTPDPERPGKPALARELVDLLAARLPDRTIHVVGDSAYAAKAWRSLPEHVTITFRLRKNAALNAPKPPPTGKRGRPAEKGKRLPSLAEIALDPATSFEQTTAKRYGKEDQLAVHLRPCLWYHTLARTPVRLLLVQDRDNPTGYELALITTDLTATPAELVERYADRWAIEVCFEEAKHQAGVGDARNRTRKAVQRTVPFQFLAMTLTITWYTLHGHHPDDVAEHRARAPWYHTKTNPSFADMLTKLRRTIIADQYSPGRLRAPYQQKITAIQQAWAAMIP